MIRHIVELFLPSSPLYRVSREKASAAWGSLVDPCQYVGRYQKHSAVPRIEPPKIPECDSQEPFRCPVCVYGGAARLCLGCFRPWGSILGPNTSRIPPTPPPPLVTVVKDVSSKTHPRPLQLHKNAFNLPKWPLLKGLVMFSLYSSTSFLLI